MRLSAYTDEQPHTLLALESVAKDHYNYCMIAQNKDSEENKQQKSILVAKAKNNNHEKPCELLHISLTRGADQKNSLKILEQKEI